MIQIIIYPSIIKENNHSSKHHHHQNQQKEIFFSIFSIKKKLKMEIANKIETQQL